MKPEEACRLSFREISQNKYPGGARIYESTNHSPKNESVVIVRIYPKNGSWAINPLLYAALQARSMRRTFVEFTHNAQVPMDHHRTFSLKRVSQFIMDRGDFLPALGFYRIRYEDRPQPYNTEII
jgi:hypothetical protein